MRAAKRASLASIAALTIASLIMGTTWSIAETGTQRPAAPACFAQGDLAAHPNEQHIVKGDRRFDAQPAKTAIARAPFVPIAERGSLRRVTLTKGKKLIALTFDLCEQTGEVAGYDGAIIDYLRSQTIKATFFAGGKWLRSHEERARQMMSDPLFEIGSHAEAHRNLKFLSGDKLTDEILGPQRSYETLRSRVATAQCPNTIGRAANDIPQRIRLFRFPYGACNASAMSAVNDAGLIAVQWDISTGDPDPHISAASVAANMMRAKPGSIIIGHANGRGHHTAEALAIAVPKLKKLGFEFVTVSELIAAGIPVVASQCYSERPGDTDRYDFLSSPGLHAKSLPANGNEQAHASAVGHPSPATKVKKGAEHSPFGN